MSIQKILIFYLDLFFFLISITSWTTNHSIYRGIRLKWAGFSIKMPLQAAVDTFYTKFSPKYTYKSIRVGLYKNWIELTPIPIEGYSMIYSYVKIEFGWIIQSCLHLLKTDTINKLRGLKDGIYIVGCSIWVLTSNPALRSFCHEVLMHVNSQRFMSQATFW